MDYFAGLDVSVKETSVCIVDDTGKIIREVKVASEPAALLAVLKKPAYRFKRIGLEAGPLSQWLFSALAEAGLPVICVETRHMRAALQAQINKTDRNDARGIAQMMRAGLYRPVHVKTLRSQKLRMLLTHRKLLQSKAIAIDNDLRGTLRNFGLKVGVVGAVKFEARIKELVENLPDLAVLVEPLLMVRRILREQFSVLHRRLLAIVRDDEVCRRLMTVPGVGPVVALTYRATVDVPARFRNSKAVGAVFGLTPSKYQSGEINRPDRFDARPAQRRQRIAHRILQGAALAIVENLMGGGLPYIQDRLALQMVRPDLLRHHDASPPVPERGRRRRGRRSGGPLASSAYGASRRATPATAASAPRRRAGRRTDRTDVHCCDDGDER